MPEFDSVILSCMHMFVSDEKDSKLIKPMPVLQKPLTLMPSQGLMFQETNSLLSFGNTPQDVLTVLGSPQHISYKKSNPLSIHERLHVRDKTEARDYQYDYFYNYFDIGLDILFDASAHFIKKFVVHTNFPTHPNFNLYQKCNFTIIPPAAPKADGEDFEEDFDDVKVITPEMKVIKKQILHWTPSGPKFSHAMERLLRNHFSCLLRRITRLEEVDIMPIKISSSR